MISIHDSNNISSREPLSNGMGNPIIVANDTTVIIYSMLPARIKVLTCCVCKVALERQVHPFTIAFARTVAALA
jgi:hypothetical protein